MRWLRERPERWDELAGVDWRGRWKAGAGGGTGPGGGGRGEGMEVENKEKGRLFDDDDNDKEEDEEEEEEEEEGQGGAQGQIVGNAGATAGGLRSPKSMAQAGRGQGRTSVGAGR